MPNRRSGEIAASKWLLLLEPSTFAALPGRDREPWGLLADFSISFIVGSTPCTPKKVGDLQRMEASSVLPGPSGVPWGGDRLSQMNCQAGRAGTRAAGGDGRRWESAGVHSSFTSIDCCWAAPCFTVFANSRAERKDKPDDLFKIGWRFPFSKKHWERQHHQHRVALRRLRCRRSPAVSRQGGHSDRFGPNARREDCFGILPSAGVVAVQG